MASSVAKLAKAFNETDFGEVMSQFKVYAGVIGEMNDNFTLMGGDTNNFEAIANTMKTVASVGRGVNGFSDSMKNFKMDEVMPQIEQFASTLIQLNAELQMVQGTTGGLEAVATTVKTINSLTSGLNRFVKLLSEMDFDALKGNATSAVGMIAEFANGINAAVTDDTVQRLNTLAESLERIARSLESMKGNTGVLSKATSGIDGSNMSSLTGGIKKLFGSNVITRIWNMTAMRLMRQIAMSILNGAKEGIDNLYDWSKSRGGEFAASMDMMASALTTVKNSLAAAAGEALNAFAPALKAVADMAVTVINAINQLFAALQGKTTFTKAAQAVEDYTHGTQKAGAATKDLLADFDELNVIQSQSGGGGGAGGSTAVDGMFEEAQINDFFMMIKEHADEILKVVGLIGAGILAWKVASSFNKDLQNIRSLIGIESITIGIALAFDAGMKIADGA